MPLRCRYLLLLIAASLSVGRGDRIVAADVGAPFDLQGFVDGELAAGKRRVVVPPGRYRVAPRDRQHLVLQDLDGVQIIADGVEMICTETTRAVTIRRCRNVTLRGLVIDYDPLPFTQGRITDISADGETYDIELFAGYPPAETARNFKFEIFRPDTRTLRCDDRHVEQVTVIDSRRLRLSLPRSGSDRPEQEGDLVVIGSEHAPHGSVPHAVECADNVATRLENITLYASNCFGFLEYNCDGSVYRRCRVDRRPAEGDLVERADPRVRSLNADAFHSKHAIKGPQYLECGARFTGDDCINICGDYHLVTASEGRQLRVLAKHQLNIEPGDPVELLAYDGRRLPAAKVTAVEPDGEIRPDEREFLSRQRMNESLRTARGALTAAYTITLDRELEVAMGGIICSANRTGNGFAVRGCQFGHNRSRGILIKGSHGEVRDNQIIGSRMHAILVAPEYWWLEAGSSSDLKISGNTIVDCGGIGIWIQAEAGNGQVAPAGAHRDIAITENTIRGGRAPGILVTSTSGLRLENNQIDVQGTNPSVSHLLRNADLPLDAPVAQIQCEP